MQRRECGQNLADIWEGSRKLDSACENHVFVARIESSRVDLERQRITESDSETFSARHFETLLTWARRVLKFKEMLTVGGDLQASISRWESATLVATVASALLTALSALFAIIAFYRKKRPHNHTLLRLDRMIGLERTSLGVSGIASVFALAGALLLIRYTVLNHQQQHLADQENLQLHKELKIAKDGSTSAVQTANAAAAALDTTKKQLATTATELAGAYQQLVEAKDRLQRVENQQKWRNLSLEQRKKMIAILSKCKGNGLAINPVANDNEVHEFATQLESVFKDSGWKTAWADFMEFSTVPGGHLREGLTLQVPAADAERHRDIAQALIDAVTVADPLVKVTYIRGDQPEQHAVHLEVGRKRRMQGSK